MLCFDLINLIALRGNYSFLLIRKQTCYNVFYNKTSICQTRYVWKNVSNSWIGSSALKIKILSHSTVVRLNFGQTEKLLSFGIIFIYRGEHGDEQQVIFFYRQLSALMGSFGNSVLIEGGPIWTQSPKVQLLYFVKFDNKSLWKTNMTAVIRWIICNDRKNQSVTKLMK